MFPTRFVPVTAAVLYGLLMIAAPLVMAEEEEQKPQMAGVVTLEGIPLAAGKITFYRDNGQFLGAKIKDGKYAIDHIPNGEYKVTIEGKGVPAKYTSEEMTVLVIKVKDGSNQVDFSLGLE